ncbi:MAG: hypothetical protein ACTSRP_18770, partial [Candidatus Helarchaeota archaeon]
YYNKALETFNFIQDNLYDSSFGGYYTALNASNFVTNSDKDIVANSQYVDALLTLYKLTYNYSYYELAEKALFYMLTFAFSSDFSIFLPKTSKIGSAKEEEKNINSLSNLMVSYACIQMDKYRTNKTAFNKPFLITNITTNKFDISSAQRNLTIYFEITNRDGTPVNGNLTVIGYVYGLPQLFIFNKSSDNKTYYQTFDISVFSEEVNIHILILNKSTASTYEKYVYSRTFPTYIKIAYETLASMYKYLQDRHIAFYNSSIGYKVISSANFAIIQAVTMISRIIGSPYIEFNWYGNDTIINNMKVITKYLENNLLTYPVDNITGFHEYDDWGVKENITKLFDNAFAVISYLDLYSKTNDSYYLEIANNTWLYINKTFWDSSLNCYRSDNSTINMNISSRDNFMAILAGLKINQTLDINQNIRNRALQLANITYQTINNSFWDKTNGGYYSYGNGSTWADFWDKATIDNSLSILVNLEIHRLFSNTSFYNNSCYRMANITAKTLISKMWDSLYGGFYKWAYANWSLPNAPHNTSKYTLDNSWAIISLIKLYNLSKNITNYYYAENALQFLITYMGNQTTGLSTAGFYSYTNRSGYLTFNPVYKIYPGDSYSSAMCIQALLLVFKIVNTSYSGNWLNGSIEFSAANTPPLGEYANLSFNLKDKQGNNLTGYINITVIKWHSQGGTAYPVIYQNLQITYDSNTETYHVGNINLSNSENIFIYIYAKNSSYGSFYNFYYIWRVKTAISSANAYKNDQPLKYLPIFGSPGLDPEKDFAFYAYVLGEDIIQIKARYVQELGFLYYSGIANAYINATIYYANNGSKWESKGVYTDEDGWFTVEFGPVANQSILEGIYNITLFASHVNASLDPPIWYSSTTYLVRVSVGYGLFISNLSTVNYTIAQGDTFNVNITIKNERISNAGANITFYGEKSFILEVNRSVIVQPGYSNFTEELKIDERTVPGDYKLYAEILYQGRWIHTFYITITVITAVKIRSILIPDRIAKYDQRNLMISLTNLKRHVKANVSIILQSTALEPIHLFKILLPNESRDFYITIVPINSVPYGEYTGTLIVKRQNYSLLYQGNEKYEFSIEITPIINISRYVVSNSILQGQNGYISLFLENFRASESKISVVYYWEGSNDIHVVNYTLSGYYEDEYLYLPFSYNALPWDYGQRVLNVQIYYIDENGNSIQIFYSQEIIEVEISTLGVFIDYLLPFIIICLVPFILFYLIFRRKEEKKKLKK